MATRISHHGDPVGPTIQDGLTTIADNGEMYVYFSLTERDIMRRMEESGSMEKMIASFPAVSLQTADGETYPLQGRLESPGGTYDENLLSNYYLQFIGFERS